MGADSTTSLDLALLKIEAPIRSVFKWSKGLPETKEAVSAGVNLADGDEGTEIAMDLTGGRLTGVVEKTYDGVGYKVIQHTTPIRKGDSGGPLVDLRGNLIGVNFGGDGVSSGYRTPLPRRSYAIRPDLKWLKILIEADVSGVAPSSN